MKSRLRACFLWAFFTKMQVSHCPLVTVPQPFWIHTSKHQLKKRAARHPCNTGQAHKRFSSSFYLCKKKGHAYSCFFPRIQIPATCEVAERACNKKVPSHGVTSADSNTEVGNNRSPPTGAPFNRWKDSQQRWHTQLALPPHCQPKTHRIFPRPFTRGLLNRWFSEGKSSGAKQTMIMN